MSRQLLADTILYGHFVYVLLVVVPVVLIPFGYYLEWKWVRSRLLRGLHLSMMGVVVLETLCGLICPLTWLENLLRTNAPQGRSFLSHWVGRLLFYEAPPWIFMSGYIGMFMLILLFWKLFPPQKKPNRAD